MSKVAPAAHDELFVGWLPMPARYKRPVALAALALLLLAPAVALAVALAQRSPGDGVWDDDTPRTFTGLAVAEPCAMLRSLGDDGQVRTILLVSDGKFGAADRLRPFAGQAVTVTGTLLHRDGRWMVELIDGDEAIKPATLSAGEAAQLRPAPPVALGEVELAGEIIDPKCYLGAMKPGGGKTHKACAALCLAGGVPPMLAVRAGNAESFYLLIDDIGRLAADAAIPLVGEPVVVTGRAERWGDLLVLRVAAVRRR